MNLVAILNLKSIELVTSGKVSCITLRLIPTRLFQNANGWIVYWLDLTLPVHFLYEHCDSIKLYTMCTTYFWICVISTRIRLWREQIFVRIEAFYYITFNYKPCNIPPAPLNNTCRLAILISGPISNITVWLGPNMLFLLALLSCILIG